MLLGKQMVCLTFIGRIGGNELRRQRERGEAVLMVTLFSRCHRSSRNRTDWGPRLTVATVVLMFKNEL